MDNLSSFKDFDESFEAVAKKLIQKGGPRKLGPSPRKKGKRVHCKFCQALVPMEEARRHDGQWVGPECWDDRLRSTE